MVNARSQYKTCLRKSRLLYDKSETDKLYRLRCQNGRDYWKLLKSASQNPNQIYLYQYLSDILRPSVVTARRIEQVTECSSLYILYKAAILD